MAFMVETRSKRSRVQEDLMLYVELSATMPFCRFLPFPLSSLIPKLPNESLVP